METRSILIAGVGGQGTLLASKLLGRLLLARGFDVKVSEVHGMSQRGGSVVTYVRWGEKVYAPIVDKGQADVILSFELLEAARWTEYLKPGGRMIANTQQINPMPVITGMGLICWVLAIIRPPGLRYSVHRAASSSSKDNITSACPLSTMGA